MSTAFDSFSAIQLEEDPGYEAYQASLEVQEYFESAEFLDDINEELRDIRYRELEMDTLSL